MLASSRDFEGTPRARATEPDQGPNLLLAYMRHPYVPHSRDREERPAVRREIVAKVQKIYIFGSNIPGYSVPGISLWNCTASLIATTLAISVQGQVLRYIFIKVCACAVVTRACHAYMCRVH